jgi:two-component system sensor histidine kinase KdpD
MKRPLAKYIIGLAAVAAVTSALAPLEPSLNVTTVALALLLTILFIATAFGSRPAFVAAVMAALGFNFFFLPPLHTFTITATQNWIALAAFLITALTAGQLSSYARRRADESERRRLEIERLYTELQSAFGQAAQAEALRQSEQLKSALLDAVTHDLRTPLTSIKAAATALLEDPRDVEMDEEARHEFLEIINEESDRLNEFIEGMVSLAKLESGSTRGLKSWNAIDEMIGIALDRAKPRLEGHRVEVELEEELPNVLVEPVSVSEVIYTLLDNAAKYSPADSTIRVGAHTVAGGIELAVEDQGRGVPEQLRERVFTKFFRNEPDEGGHATGGLGLGLAIARGIVQSQGGKIWIENGNDGFATKVVVQIPVGDE